MYAYACDRDKKAWSVYNHRDRSLYLKDFAFACSNSYQENYILFRVACK